MDCDPRELLIHGCETEQQYRYVVGHSWKRFNGEKPAVIIIGQFILVAVVLIMTGECMEEVRNY